MLEFSQLPERSDTRARTLWSVVRIYLLFLVYLEVALILAGNGVATFPWGTLMLGPREFADQGVVLVLSVLGYLGVYIVNRKRSVESRQVTAE